MSALVSRPSSAHLEDEPATFSSPSSPSHARPTSPSHGGTFSLSYGETFSSSHSLAKNANAAVPPTVKKGDRLAHFFILSALSCVLYQFVTNGGGQLTMKTDASHQSSSSTSSSIQFSSSEYTCILACMGLFGLMRHKTKEAAKQGAEEEEDEEEHDEIARELLLTEKRVRTFKRKQDASLKRMTDVLALSRHQSACGAFNQLPQEVLHELLLFLGPQELSQLPILNKHWNATTGDDADKLWHFVYLRDFKESGERFHVVFPFDSWRQFYFQHHLSRAVELARLLGLGLQEDKKLCVAIENQVYDVTSFIHSHPGGYHVIGDVVGTDATEIWDQFQHSQEAKESMKEFMVHDHILSQSTSGGRDNLRLRGNLAVVVTRWERISWCLANSHNFGPMASTFTDVMFKFHSRAIKKSRENARLGLAR